MVLSASSNSHYSELNVKLNFCYYISWHHVLLNQINRYEVVIHTRESKYSKYAPSYNPIDQNTTNRLLYLFIRAPEVVSDQHEICWGRHIIYIATAVPDYMLATTLYCVLHGVLWKPLSAPAGWLVDGSCDMQCSGIWHLGRCFMEANHINARAFSLLCVTWCDVYVPHPIV